MFRNSPFDPLRGTPPARPTRKTRPAGPRRRRTGTAAPDGMRTTARAAAVAAVAFAAASGASAQASEACGVLATEEVYFSTPELSEAFAAEARFLADLAQCDQQQPRIADFENPTVFVNPANFAFGDDLTVPVAYSGEGACLVTTSGGGSDPDGTLSLSCTAGGASGTLDFSGAPLAGFGMHVYDANINVTVTCATAAGDSSTYQVFSNALLADGVVLASSNTFWGLRVRGAENRCASVTITQSSTNDVAWELDRLTAVAGGSDDSGGPDPACATVCVNGVDDGCTGQCTCSGQWLGAACDVCATQCGVGGSDNDCDGACDACAGNLAGPQCDVCTTDCGDGGSDDDCDGACDSCPNGFTGDACDECATVCALTGAVDAECVGADACACPAGTKDLGTGRCVAVPEDSCAADVQDSGRAASASASSGGNCVGIVWTCPA